MILYTFIQFHSTPAIVTSVFIGLGIVFCGCAMVHNVFVWQKVSAAVNGFRALLPSLPPLFHLSYRALLPSSFERRIIFRLPSKLGCTSLDRPGSSTVERPWWPLQRDRIFFLSRFFLVDTDPVYLRDTLYFLIERRE